MKTTARVCLALWVAFCVALPPVGAQTELGSVFKKKYKLRTVQCAACHVKSETGDDEKEEEESKDDADHKKPLNAFGEVLQKLVAGKNINDRLKAAKKATKEDKEKVVKEVGEDFLKALEKLDTMNAPSGKTYAAAVAAGEIEGTKTRK